MILSKIFALAATVAAIATITNPAVAQDPDKCGQIHIQTFIDAGRPVDATEVSALNEDVQGTGVVIGGTGAYLFARGSYASDRDGEMRTYMLNIKCD
ncbi:MAG: hypothetical protein GY798_29315 [Hyphomicrobiales bacterium]|nr:hypothetical protein [Hyphomicrobiales bacterium]